MPISTRAWPGADRAGRRPRPMTHSAQPGSTNFVAAPSDLTPAARYADGLRRFVPGCIVDTRPWVRQIPGRGRLGGRSMVGQWTSAVAEAPLP
ncbi:hypothetical protein Maq22A_c28290 [Methylobacterium aquaticum]|uniref:Uncharacterized protein n=1 Tax=Methylobacterium aquaticum TaxID=270351 RepID=A0A1Y0ZIL4_9HYPH|nr:hypothetical protein Maq22A_c28290 [Methylobacterium aquaticum]